MLEQGLLTTVVARSRRDCFVAGFAVKDRVVEKDRLILLPIAMTVAGRRRQLELPVDGTVSCEHAPRKP
jgi:hypothetical protein